MLLFAYYLLKVIICSGILYGYYLLALRNKIFHGWNRFYLLSAIILSLTVPLIKINIFQNSGGPTQVIRLLQVVSTGDEFVYEYTKNGGFHIDATNLSLFIYTVVSIFLLVILIQTLIKITKLKKDNTQTIVEGVNFINTKAEGTPFSFFNNIFWNDKIDINSATGKQIFKHEVAHVQENHSYDKIFINLVLIFFWCNPFFWLIRKELNIIHEFIADKKALEDSDTAAFAAMILQATYPQQRFAITNNFFYSPLKRRLIMLAKNKNPKMNYISRLLVLPLAALIFFAFTLKMKPTNSLIHYAGEKITVVIDAGHGGDDNGVVVNNIKEKDLTLLIAKVIKEINTNESINIVLSREQDETISVKDRVKIAETEKADLFISIHIDGAMGSSNISGLHVLIPNNDNAYIIESKILGSSIIESFKNNYPLKVANEVMQREKGVWILNKNKYPSILIETGVLTTQKDMFFLIKAENQKTIARNILNGIEKYAMQNSTTVTDTVPKKKRGGFFVDTKNKNIFYYDTLIQITKPENNFIDVPKSLLIMNGEKIDNSILTDKAIKSKTLTIYSSKDQNTINKYGDQGRNGVFVFEDGVIIDKPDFVKNFVPKNTNNQKDMDKVFTKVEVEASFPGGDMVWARYIKKIIEKNIEELAKENKSGTCRIRFIVHEDGTISNVEALTMQGTKLAEIAINAIRKGPKWVPAKQSDHVVSSYREQPITFTIQDATGNNIVETGDNIMVYLQRPGNRNLQIKHPITNAGTIFYSGNYVIVKGLMFEDAKNLVKNLYQKVEAPGTEIEISINKKS